MDFPAAILPPFPILTPWVAESAGPAIFGLGGGGIGTATSSTWPANNLALFYPFKLADWATVYQLFFWVGATSSGNIDVGIYDSQKNRIVSAGTTAMSATVNTIQELNVTDTVLGPGSYLLGAACSTTVGTGFRVTNTDEVYLPSFPGYEQATALPLPDPCVPVVNTQANVTVFVAGAQLRSVF